MIVCTGLAHERARQHPVTEGDRLPRPLQPLKIYDQLILAGGGRDLNEEGGLFENGVPRHID